MTDSPRTHTKGDLTRYCFDELAIANGVFDVTPEMTKIGLDRLHALIARWEADGIGLGYAFATTYGQDLESELSGMQDAVIETVGCNLAVRVGPVIGKAVSAETKKAASEGLAFLRAQTAVTPVMSLQSRTPLGEGNRGWPDAPSYPEASEAEEAL